MGIAKWARWEGGSRLEGGRSNGRGGKCEDGIGRAKRERKGEINRRSSNGSPETAWVRRMGYGEREWEEEVWGEA